MGFHEGAIVKIWTKELKKTKNGEPYVKCRCTTHKKRGSEYYNDFNGYITFWKDACDFVEKHVPVEGSLKIASCEVTTNYVPPNKYQNFAVYEATYSDDDTVESINKVGKGKYANDEKDVKDNTTVFDWMDAVLGKDESLPFND